MYLVNNDFLRRGFVIDFLGYVGILMLNDLRRIWSFEDFIFFGYLFKKIFFKICKVGLFFIYIIDIVGIIWFIIYYMFYFLKVIFVVDLLYFVKCVYIVLLNIYIEKVCLIFEI